MKLDWYTCLGNDGHSNARTSVLWTEYGLYQWINRLHHGLNKIEIVFFPKPNQPRVIERLGIFETIAQAEAAVERDLDSKSGRWLSVREECENMIDAAMLSDQMKRAFPPLAGTPNV